MSEETPPTPENGAAVAQPQTAPQPSEAQQRIRGLTEDRNRLSGKLKEANERVEALELANADSAGLVKQIEALKSKHKAAASGWAEERTWLSHGFSDAPGQAAAKAYYQALPEEGRPALDEWVGGLGSDEEAATKYPLLAGYIGGKAPATAPASPKHTTPSGPPSAAGSVSDEARKLLLERASKTAVGSPEWAAFNAAVGYRR